MAAKKPAEYDELDRMRHSAAHLLAAAVTKMFPEAKLGVGPVIENGFYYDMQLPRALGPEDFAALEKTIEGLKKENAEFRREEMPIDQAIEFFRSRNQDFKVELLSDLKAHGTTNLKDEDAQDVDGSGTASLYWTGDFVDLCRGPHVERSGEVGAIKLKSVAGAYWRGKAENAQMQRVYGWAFRTKEELEAHLKMLEEAEKRDHRKLGKDMGLFVFSELVGPGLPLWTPRGTMLRETLNEYVWELRRAHGYQRVTIPHITKKDLYETSGHWAKYGDDLFKIKTREEHLFAMKPMNCPHHTQIFDSEPRSYRQMPVRYCETTMVYRDEQSGELSGLSRVLSITQDDAHVFCRMNQVREEAEKVWDIIETFYKTFGFELSLRLSRRDPAQPEKYLGAPEDWDAAENALREILDAHKVEWVDGVGEAAFYGPKIDFMAKDSIGRVWQVATIQLDFNQPKNFGLSCTNEKGEKEQILMIHCAIMGSIERFMSVIIEHFAGAFPLWLAAEQIALLPVGEKHREPCRALEAKLRALGARPWLDESDESVGKKVRGAEKMKIPYSLVLGDKEIPADGDWNDDVKLAVRVRGTKDAVEMTLGELSARIKEEIATRKLAP
ncbi:MAG: threonine--tRNA ligase [Patescibacteria group bacterium]|nr:MAG: threonine--tRNA ligase [Patescibacteria group bacterium]